MKLFNIKCKIYSPIEFKSKKINPKGKHFYTVIYNDNPNLPISIIKGIYDVNVYCYIITHKPFNFNSLVDNDYLGNEDWIDIDCMEEQNLLIEYLNQKEEK